MAFQMRSPEVLARSCKTNGNPRDSRMAGAINRAFGTMVRSGCLTQRRERGFVLQQRGALLAPSARSGGLDDVDGSPDCRVYIQMCRIEQVCVRRPFQRRGGAVLIAVIPPANVGKDLIFVDFAALSLIFGGPAARTHLGRRGNEDLNVGIRTNDGPDIAPVEDGAGRPPGKFTLEGQQSFTHLDERGDDRRRFTGTVGLERGFVERGWIKDFCGGGGGFKVVRLPARIEHGLGDRAIDQTRIEVAQAIVGGKPLAERPFARRGRTVDGYDHVRSAPTDRINSTKPGKLVAMNALSSMRTAFSLASPMTSADMAIR